MADVDNQRIVIFYDTKNEASKGNIWGRVSRTVKRRTENGTREELVTFDSYTELVDFLEENIAREDDGSYSNLDYKKNFVKDYDLLENRQYFDKPELNHLTLYYYTIDSEKRQCIHLPVEFKNTLLSKIKANKGLPDSISEDALDWYKVVKGFSPEYRQAVSRTQFSYSAPVDARFSTRREISYVPMHFEAPIKKIDTGTRSTKRVAIFLLAILLLFVGGKKGYRSLIKTTHGNGGDCFSLGNIANDTDLELYLGRFETAETMESLVKGDYDKVSTSQLENFFKYISKLELSNYDNNESFNRIKLGDLKYFIKCSNIRDLKPMMDLVDKYDAKHDACFRRSNPNDNKIVLQNEKTKSCLNWILPMILLNCKNYDSRFGNVPISNGSSFNEHATSEEIRLFGLLPDAIRLPIIENAQKMYSHAQNYSFQHPSYFGKDVLQDLETAKGECTYRMTQAVSNKTNIAQNLSADHNRGSK